MSLLGNRGRFSPEEKNDIVVDAGLKSVISLVGKNPTFIFNIKKEDNKENDIKEKLTNANLKEYNSRSDSKHLEYNERLKKQNDKYDDLFYSYKKRSEGKIFASKKRKVSIPLIVTMFIVESITIAILFFVGSFIRLSNTVEKIPFDPKVVVSPYIDEKTINIQKGYKTVAIFGVDSRNGSIAKGNNADVNLLVNLNVETGEIQLISLYRDLYLSVTDHNSYDKLNSAYTKGGPEAAVKAINKNFDLSVVNFFAFNWKAVADGINLLGGIDLEITGSEYKYMNAFIHETCIATGVDAKNPAAHYIKSTGMQHLDGIQAVAYGRLRLMDSDFQRVERQKKVITLCLQKAKDLDIIALRGIMEVVLPQIAYEFDYNEMVSLLRIVRNVAITESAGCPDTTNVMTMNMGSSGACVVPINLEKAVIKLHKILFNVDDYQVSQEVRRYSNRIAELRKKYQAENELEESRKASEAAESMMESLNHTKKSSSSRNVSSKSNADRKPRSTASRSNVKRNNNAPVDTTIYEEEPEEDSSSNNVVVIVDGPPKGVEATNQNANNTNSTNNTNNTSNINNSNNASNNDTVVGVAPGGTNVVPNNNNAVRSDNPPTGNEPSINSSMPSTSDNIPAPNIGGGPTVNENLVEPIIVIP